jgi:hypothetical protein
MSKRRRLRLKSAPVLVTKLRRHEWESGVLLLQVESGPDQGTFALSPNMAMQVFETLRRAILNDPASPLNPRVPARRDLQQPAEEKEGVKP